MLRKSVLTAFALLGLCGAAAAEPISLPGNTPLVMDFENIEQLNIAPDALLAGSCIDVPTATYGCADNWGFLRILTIRDSVALVPNADIADGGVTTLYDTGANGTTEIFGIFYDIQLTGCSGSGAATCTATGGVLELYWHDTGIAGVSVVAQLDDTAASVTAVNSGTLLARLFFDNGIIDNDESTTITSSINLTNPASFAEEGTANGFMSVQAGAGVWADVLDGNWFHIDGGDAGSVKGNSADEFRDVKFRNVFNAIGADHWNGTNIIGLTSSDPAEVFTAPIPEPATLTLLGAGLLGLARRRRSKVA